MLVINHFMQTNAGIVIHKNVLIFLLLCRPKYPRIFIAIVKDRRPLKSQMRFVFSNPYSDSTCSPFCRQGKSLDARHSKRKLVEFN